MIVEPAEQLVTVFGGGGFVGRYVCETLLKKGVRVRVAAREPRTAHFLQPLAQVGQIGFVRADVGSARSVERAVESVTSVINLVGSFKNMHAMHVTGPRTIANAAREAGAGALVHISAIGADAEAESAYGRTKGQGEQAVREAFPGATLIRPSLVFGPEDELTNRFAALGSSLPVLPVIAPTRRFQPVYVRDLAQAIAAAALDPAEHGGKIYEIGGPEVMTMRGLMEAVCAAAGCKASLVDMPDFAADMMSRLGFLPGAPLTRDQWLMLQRDNVVSGAGLEAFGIKPTPLAAVAEEWLGRFGGSRFAQKRVNMTATS